MGMIENKELDVILNIAFSEERAEMIAFSDPYFEFAAGLYTRIDFPDIHSIDDLYGKKFAVPNGFFYEEIFTDHPQVELVRVLDTREAILAVANGRADAMIDLMPVVNYFLSQLMITNLRVGGTLGIDEDKPIAAHLGVRNDWGIFRDILNKGMKSLTRDEIVVLEDRWFGYSESVDGQGYLTGSNEIDEVARDFSIVDLLPWFAVMVVAFLIVILIFKRLRSEAFDRIFQHRGFSSLGIVFVIGFLAVVLFVSWLALERMDSQLRTDKGDTLVTINQSIQNSLEMWLESRTREIQYVAGDRALVPVVKRLLALPRDALTISSSEAQGQMRDIYSYYVSKMDVRGFFIIAPDRMSVGSSRDSNIGKINFIAERYPALLNRAFGGETVFVPPIYSDVALKDAEGQMVEKLSTMFLATPVRDSTNSVIAVLTLRFDPANEFGWITAKAQMGKTGETYAFDRQARLVTPSRFTDSLEKQIEYFQSRSHILNLQIRDPGGNLLDGFQPEKLPPEWPLTRMAQSAVGMNSGTDTTGYRDYRGVPVFGAWSWSDKLGVGLATEIDISEALQSYHSMRKLVLGALVGISFIALLLTAVSVWIGERARNRLQTLVDKRTEELRKLVQAVEQSPATVVITDRSGTIEYVNPRFTDVTGYGKEEAIGNNPRFLKSDKTPPSLYTELWETILDKKIWQGEMVNTIKSGAEIWESVSISPIMNTDDQIRNFVAVKENITARKKVERELIDARQEAEDATRAKSDFLANMSHEIRTPMNAIIGLDSLLAKTDLIPKQQDYVEKIGQAAKNLLGIINDILDFSKIEAGKLDIEETTFDLNGVLGNLSEMIGDKAREKGLELIFSHDAELHHRLVGDPLRIGQILLNLANNAIKFTTHGEIVVITKLVKKDDSEVLIRFEVKDTGIGLTEDQVGKLFQSFAQADTSTTRKYGGTGLGLSISKRLSEMMGGEIGVESEFGRGSTFYFTVRCRIGKGKTSGKPVAPEDLKGLKVLIVDDNDTAREVLTSYTNDFSFQVTAVPSGELAIRELVQSKAVEHKDYDLVLIDYQMPGMNGIETSEKIRRELENVEAPKIVMVTGFGREEIMRQAEKAGLHGFLIKPVSPSMLLDTIMDVFGKNPGLKERMRTPGVMKPEGFEMIRGAHILLAEDNEINQQVAVETLEAEGFFVDVAENGKIAVDTLARQGIRLDLDSSTGYELILMDLQMPVLDGYEATKEIRQNIPSAELPIIAMTADAMAGVRESVLEVGMNDYITKPIEPIALWEALVKWTKPGDRKLPEAFAERRTSSNSSAFQLNKAIYLPEIDGIEIEAGLRRVGGNRRLYLDLLHKFRTDFAGVVDDIRSALETGDAETAKRLAHTVKGVAGNVGAVTVREAAAILDSQLKQAATTPGSVETTVALAAFDTAIRQLISAMAVLPLEADQDDESVVKEELNIGLFKDLLHELKPALQKRQPKRAGPVIDRIASFAIPAEHGDDVEFLRNYIKKYKFKDAQALAESLLEKLG